MRNIKVTIEYDGTNYHGFQVQGKTPTIQSVLQDAIERITGTRSAVTGAGRTDAGVHARGQVINFKTHSRIPVEKFAYALNSVLPDDVVAVSAEEVPQDFHSRYSATSKVYNYTFWNARFHSPFWRSYALWVSQELDVEAMRAAAGDYVGRHDFAAFRSTGSSAVTTVRTVYHSAVQVSDVGHSGRGRLLVFTVEADGFLYNMVRIMAGTLLEVGIGKRDPGDIRLALAEPSRDLAGPTLPPHGLCLKEVRYGPLFP